MKRNEKALEYWNKGFNCAQAVLAAFHDITDASEEQLLKTASGFGGGMGRMQNTCGAVTGAFMVFGCIYGRYKPEDSEAAEKTYALVRQFSKKFIELHGTISCKELIGCDLMTEEGQKFYTDNNLKKNVCAECISHSAETVEGMLNEKQHG